ncbi:MAG: dicarboxylate/amino acid:cation symporter [Gammaproteobacteria bacterium]|nr:dicarboxylate/amino acid:cation symporter [Gammaproteobacteria bacterium]
MCTANKSKQRFLNTFTLYTLMIVLGIASGLSDISLFKNFGLAISDIFIRIFRCISLPIIALSLIVTLSSYRAEGVMKKIWQRIILYTLSTTIIAATVSCLLYLLINPANINRTTSIPVVSASSTNYFQHLASLIPANIFAPFIDYQVMAVLLVGIIIGIAIRYIPEEGPRNTITQFFKGIHGVFLVITKWVVTIIPLGLYGFITATVVQLREGMNIGGIGQYLAVVVLANLVQGLIVLPLWLRLNNIRPFETLRKMMPALSVAFFSKSSAGTLPITIETAEKNLNINARVSRLVLPLCTSINMNGCAAFIFATVIYLMQNHGIEITFGKMIVWIFIATIAAIGNAGVPMGCFFLSASLLSSMNIPIALMGVILPFYSLIDMIETSLNVWSDSCVTTVINARTVDATKQSDLGESDLALR